MPAIDTGGFRATVLAGSALGHGSPATVYTPLVGIDLSSAGPARTRLHLRADFEYAVMVLRGAATVAGEPLAPGAWLYFAPGRTAMEVHGDAAAQLLLLGGEPFDEALIVWWNLVARSQTEIEAALTDWHAGRFAPVRPGSLAAPLTAPSLDGVRLRASTGGD
ncbi:MAG TPA: pirin-like C-terminal cupin domain-containing protein [Ottowia sp.]|nr:pirin-like C-terminal cupin domain-containing protein [Ottowia sp.]